MRTRGRWSRGVAATSLVLLLSIPSRAGGVAADLSPRPAPPRVGHVEFEGNESFPDRALREWVRLAPPRIGAGPPFSTSTLNDDIARIRRFYRGEGHLRAHVDAVVDSISADRVDVRFHIEEGPLWSVVDLDLQLVDDFGRETLRDSLEALLTVTPGGPYRLAGLLEDRRSLYADLAGRGYLDAQVRVEANRIDTLRTARLRYRIRPGPRARVRDIRIEGLVKTRPGVVEREVTLHPGDPLLPEAAGRSRANLLRTSLFRGVVVGPAPEDSGEVWKDLVVSVEERRGGDLGAGIGWGSADRLRALASVEQRNVDGRGIRVAARGRIGERRRGGEVELGLPWIADHRLSTTFHIGYEWRAPRAFRMEATRGSIHISRPLGYIWRPEVGYRMERAILLATHVADVHNVRTRIGSLSVGLSRDGRDDISSPERGSYLRLSREWVAPWLGGSHRFERTELLHRQFVTVGTVVVATRWSGGWLNAHDPHGRLPLSQRYFAGGAGTVRGFPEDAIGPSDDNGVPRGARILATGSLEVVFPLSRHIGLVLLGDVGDLVNRAVDLRLSDLSVGAGTGLRFDSPVGRVRIEVAVPVTMRYASNPQVYVATGSSF